MPQSADAARNLDEIIGIAQAAAEDIYAALPDGPGGVAALNGDDVHAMARFNRILEVARKLTDYEVELPFRPYDVATAGYPRSTRSTGSFPVDYLRHVAMTLDQLASYLRAGQRSRRAKVSKASRIPR